MSESWQVAIAGWLAFGVIAWSLAVGVTGWTEYFYSSKSKNVVLAATAATVKSLGISVVVLSLTAGAFYGVVWTVTQLGQLVVGLG